MELLPAPRDYARVPARHLIHTAGLVWKGYGKKRDDLLQMPTDYAVKEF